MKKAAIILLFLTMTIDTHSYFSDCQNSYPIFKACRYGNLNELKKLINKKTNLNIRCRYDYYSETTPILFYLASEYGHLKIIQFLLLNGAKVNFTSGIYNKTPLHIASQYGHLNIVQYLLAKGADSKKKTNRQESALYISALYNRMDIIKYLTDYIGYKQIDNENFLKF